MWARRRGKFRRFEPVTLVEALRAEAEDCWAGMVGEHRTCLSAIVELVNAGELSAALRPAELEAELPEQLVRECEQTLAAAMLTAADCLAGLSDMMQTFGELAGD